jgi:hypothetical protein
MLRPSSPLYTGCTQRHRQPNHLQPAQWALPSLPRWVRYGEVDSVKSKTSERHCRLKLLRDRVGQNYDGKGAADSATINFFFREALC